MGFVAQGSTCQGHVPSGGVAGPCFLCTQHLLQSCSTDDLPDFLEKLGKFNLTTFGCLNFGVTAEDLQRGTHTGEYQVCATHAFSLQPSSGQRTNRVFGPRMTGRNTSAWVTPVPGHGR